MCWKSVWILILSWSSGSRSLVCYNCSTMHRDWSWCAGDFVNTDLSHFNTSKMYLVNCTGDNAMCFVRAWTARAQHSWLVQRGCYQPVGNDPLPRTLNSPNRAMSCKYERYPEAEYKVCLCQADWCNSGTKLMPFFMYPIKLIRTLLNYLLFRLQLFIHTCYKYAYMYFVRSAVCPCG